MKASKPLTQKQRKILFCIAVLTPVFLLFLIIRIIPILKTLYLSMYRTDLVGFEQRFVGITNFVKLAGDPRFRLAFLNTTIFSAVVVPLSIVLALFLATLLNNKRIRFVALFETLFFLPFIIPMVPTCMIWLWVYDASNGLLNHILRFIGMAPRGWLIDARVAVYSIAVMTAWKYMGFYMVVFLVGLKNIPGVYYEAAIIDGASRLRAFGSITLPLLKPIFLFATVICTVLSFNVFTQMYVMTGGGSGVQTEAEVRVLVYDMYQNALYYSKVGYASAEAVILLVVVLSIAWIQFKVFKTS